MVQVDYKTDRAVLSVSGEITDELVIDLVAQVRRLADECFYDLVEVEITSNGGAVQALRYFVEALDAFRRDGVSVTTRALARAGSAAAVMLSMGDRREAAPGAALTYHSARTDGIDRVTSRTAAVLHGVLSTVDGWMMGRLAERGLRAGRGIPAPCRRAAAALSEGDLGVVRRLLRSVHFEVEGLKGVLERDDPAALLACLRGVVDGCGRDAAGMARLYDALFSLDESISAALAREFRLVDELVAPGGGAGKPRGAGGCFLIPEWRAAFGPDGRVGRGLLCRHVLILGETGSGKTASGVLPAVGAMFDRRNPLGCALVVDPKREIDGALDALRRTGGAEVRVFEPKSDPGGPTLNVMAGPRWSVEADVEEGRFLTAAHRILVRTGALSTTSPGASLAGHPVGQHRDPYWPAEGARLGRTVLALALMLIRRRREVFAGLDSPWILSASPAALAAARRFGEEAGFLEPAPELGPIAREAQAAADRLSAHGARDESDDGWDESAERKSLQAAERFVGKVMDTRIHRVHEGFQLGFEEIAHAALSSPCGESLRRAAGRLATASLHCVEDSGLRPSPNVLALAGRLVRSLFQKDTAGGRAVQPAAQADGQSMLAAQSRMRLPAAVLAHALLPLAEGGEAAETLNEIEEYWLPLSRADSQYSGVLTFAQQCFWEFSDPVPAWTLRFGVEPGDRRDGAAGGFDFAAAVDDEERRTVFLVQPRLGGGKDLIAKALKAAFFEAVLNSPKRVRRGGEMPLVGYVADECHRFVTSDEVHGEQSFLDACRSFGAFCVLACQSASSLEHALAAGGGSADANRAALSVLLNNAATKLLFRSTDDATRARLDRLCPKPTSGPKVVDVRPPSTLRPGECYAVTADGRFERRQLEAFDADRTAVRLEAESRPDSKVGRMAARPQIGGVA